MTKQIADLPPWPEGWSDININRSVREALPSYRQHFIEHESVPAREGGLTLSGKTLPDRNVELDQMFFAYEVLWKITGFRAHSTYLEIHAVSVASLSDLIELLPT